MPHAFEAKLEIRRYRDSDREDVWSLHRNAIEQIEALDAGDDYYADLHDIATAYLEPAGEFLVGRVEGASLRWVDSSGPRTAKPKSRG